ncbi:hypothetical protein [Mucisphaera sp.]|uniref:hypothetical protein n=1 Tax=Mucisphaera sp. TaxID=2913024 RepID=UPI003D0A7BA0
MRYRWLPGMLVLTLCFASTSAAERIVVGEGQVITEIELAAGVFEGQSFTLGPDLVIDVLAGGVVGNSFEIFGPTGNHTAVVDFKGSLINLYDGALLGNRNRNDGSRTTFGYFIPDEAIVHVYPGGVVDGLVGTNSNVVIQGGHIELLGGRLGGRQASSHRVTMMDGTISYLRHLKGSIEIHGGTYWGINTSGSTHGNESNEQAVVRGGSVRDLLLSDRLEVYGSEFRIGHQPVNPSLYGQTLSGSAVTGNLYATLSDGSVFMHRLNGESLVLHQHNPPPVLQKVLVASIDGIPRQGVREHQTLVLDSSEPYRGLLDAAPESLVIALEGSDLDLIRSYAGSVRVAGANIGTLEVYEAATVDITQGSIRNLISHPSSESSVINLHEGMLTLRSAVSANLNVTGGELDARWSTYGHEGSSWKLSGGTYWDEMPLNAREMIFEGDDFRINGEPVALTNPEGTHYRLFRRPFASSTNALLTGVFKDGTPFAFSLRDGHERFTSYYEEWEGDHLGESIIFRQASPEPATPGLLEVSEPHSDHKLRATQILRVSDGGSLPSNFNAGEGSRIEVLSGGSIGSNLEMFNAEILIEGGRVGPHFDAFGSTHVLVRDGLLATELGRTRHEDEWTGADFDSDSRLVMTGGSTYIHDLSEGAVAHISGGNFGITKNHGIVILYGHDFKLTSSEYGPIVLDRDFTGKAIRISEAHAQLDIVWADSSTTDYRVRSIDYGQVEDIRIVYLPLVQGDFDQDGRIDLADLLMLDQPRDIDLYYDVNHDGLNDQSDLTLWLETIAGTRLGDLNLDQAIGLGDLGTLVRNFGGVSAGYLDGDLNGDQAVDLIDLSMLASNFGWATSVPEPMSALILFGSVCLYRIRF